MKALFAVILLSLHVGAAPPLQVTAVVRLGAPPFEDSERLYRLEGENCLSLRVNERLTLLRHGERRDLGRLQVTDVKDGYALARLAVGGETYPLKGDLVIRHEMALGLPSLPLALAEGAGTSAEALAPKAPRLAIPRSLPKEAPRQEPIFFFKGNAELSPAARGKLQTWVAAWGLDGRWLLLVPAAPESQPVIQARVTILRESLKSLGVKEVEVRVVPEAPSGRYDSVHLALEPW
jgi:hypothetical protein